MPWTYSNTWGGSSVGPNFTRPDAYSPSLIKTGLASLQVKPGTAAMIGNKLYVLPQNTDVTMPALEGGKDYAVYLCTDNTARASASFTAPAGYTAENSRMIGGFHYSAIPLDATLASGQFATSGQDVIWNQTMLDGIKGINKYSIWDLHWRPTCSSPHGMVFVPELRIWVDIYLTNTTPEIGTSLHNSIAASGSALPVKPSSRGGNGSSTYPRLGWWEAAEIATAAGKRLITEREFNNAAIGVTENSSLESANNPLTTTFEPRYTSIYGAHQMTGCHWVWGEDHGTRDVAAASEWNWRDVTASPSRGWIYTETASSDVRVLLGGNRSSGSISGSRAANWNSYPWNSNWSIGVRCACDHLQLA